MSPDNKAEVPVYVQSVQPKYIPFPLEFFSSNGELFPTEDEIRNFNLEIWGRWRDVPNSTGTPPHVFVIDFTGIGSVRPENLVDGFSTAIAVSGKRQGNHRVYSVFDNILNEPSQGGNLYQTVSSSLGESRTGPVVIIARAQGERKFGLIGKPEKVYRFTHPFALLAQEDGWVRGIDFNRRRLAQWDYNEKYARALLHEMHVEGITLQTRFSGRPYYRSIV